MKFSDILINGEPILVFGNCAHKFFKKVSRITLSTPYARRVIYDSDTPYSPYPNDSFYIFKNGKLQEIKTTPDHTSGYYQQEYYEYVRRNLPKE